MVSFGWGGWDRTSACGFQRPMPYHLATPQGKNILLIPAVSSRKTFRGKGIADDGVERRFSSFARQRNAFRLREPSENSAKNLLPRHHVYANAFH